MNGYRTIVSNQVASGDLYFGDFSAICLLDFGAALTILVDPFTASTIRYYPSPWRSKLCDCSCTASRLHSA
jgi:hypothetical protein